MAGPPNPEPRPLAFEEGNFYWNLHRVPRTLTVTLPDGTKKTEPHPGRTCAIFVVHGIGQQHWTETAAQLRAGFEDAFERIAKWQAENPRPKGSRAEKAPPEPTGGDNPLKSTPPFIYLGYWLTMKTSKRPFPRTGNSSTSGNRIFSAIYGSTASFPPLGPSSGCSSSNCAC